MTACMRNCSIQQVAQSLEAELTCMSAMVADLQSQFRATSLNCNLISLTHACSLGVPERVALRGC